MKIIAVTFRSLPSYALSIRKMKTCHDVEQGRVTIKTIKTKSNDRNFGKNLVEYLIDYSNNSTIQGIRYLGETSRNIYERFFWIIVLIISIYFCSCLILQVYRKWQNSPVIVTFSNNLTPVWTVPFPAITICPENKSRKSIYDYEVSRQKFETNPSNMTEEEIKRFEQMNFLCGNSWSKGGNKVIGNDTIDFIVDVAPTCDEWGCRWNNTITLTHEYCSTILTPVITAEGLCFSFNMLDKAELFTTAVYYPKQLFKHDWKSSNWSLEQGYSQDDYKMNDYPRRTSAGFILALSVTIYGFQSDLDYACRGTVGGYKIMLHNPAEVPRTSRSYFMVSTEKQIVVTMKPDMMTTSDELQSYDPQTRQCYYSYEKQLHYYKVYTQSNCEVECLTNNTLKMCGCVAFYMPRNQSTPICGRGSVICMATAENTMISREMKRENVKYDQGSQSCNCLPSCTSLSYNSEISEVDFAWKELLIEKSIDEDVSNLTLTQIFFFFDVPYFITTERQKLYGITEFIAYCGGFLGLFMGFSFISAIEIIYFLAVRVVVNIRNYGFRFWSGAPTKNSNNTISKLPLKRNIFLQERLTIIDLEKKNLSELPNI